MAAKKKATVKTPPKKVIKGKAKTGYSAKKTLTSNISKTQLLHLRAIIGESIFGMSRVLRAIGPAAGPSSKWAKYESGEEKIPINTLVELVDFAIEHRDAVPVIKTTARGSDVIGVLSPKTLRSAKSIDGGYKVTCKFTPKPKRGTSAKEVRTTLSVVSKGLTANRAALAFVSDLCTNGG